jgi:RNA polymerase-binding protein DksA|tara:strand:+ start:2267 stop:2623 length:357 start_codon:yes stop_codon:yes gene_type:complete
VNEAEIKASLEAARDAMLARRERIARHTEHRETPLPQDFAEQAVERENEETMLALQEEMNVQLPRIERALARLAAGTYGECESCGEDIDPMRLEALPATTMCVECARANDEKMAAGAH